MPDPEGFRPSLAAILEILDAERAASDSVELPVRDLPLSLGMESAGTTWLTVQCDPSSVVTDDRSPSVVVEAVPSGARVRVAGSVDRTVALHFLEEIVALLDDGHPLGSAPSTALQRWREALAQAPGARLGDAAIAGLFGELEVLESVLHSGGELEHWTGWLKDHSDFRLPGLAIEVKSTTSADFRRVEIHGLRQLDDPEDGSRLLLVLRRLERSPDGRSVPDLVEAIVAAGAARSELLDRLSRIGYFDQHRTAYDAVRFSSEELVVREVDEHHPRLTAVLLDRVDLTAIDKISYELNLNAHHDHDLNEDLNALIVTALEARDDA